MFDSIPKRIYDAAVEDRRAAEARTAQVLALMMPRDAHAEVVRQLQRQIDANRVDLSHYVAREVHDVAVESLRQQLELSMRTVELLRSQLEKVTDEAMAMKRNDLGMVPNTLDMEALDPMNAFGPKVQAAIDEFSDGRADARMYLINFAHQHLGEYRLKYPADGDLDDALAKRILSGDTD